MRGGVHLSLEHARCRCCTQKEGVSCASFTTTATRAHSQGRGVPHKNTGWSLAFWVGGIAIEPVTAVARGAGQLLGTCRAFHSNRGKQEEGLGLVVCNQWWADG